MVYQNLNQKQLSPDSTDILGYKMRDKNNESFVEQGTPQKPEMVITTNDDLQEDNLIAAIEVVQQQATIYKDAGLTQITNWLE